MGETPSSARVIEDVYIALEALDIVFRANFAGVEDIVDRNWHRSKEIGEGKSVSWGGTHSIRVSCDYSRNK